VLEKARRGRRRGGDEEFHPGFRNSVAALHGCRCLNPKVIPRSGLRGTVCGSLSAAWQIFCAGRDPISQDRLPARPNEKVAKFSARDAARLAPYGERLDVMAEYWRDLCSRRRRMSPPAAGLGDALIAAQCAIGQTHCQLDMSMRRESSICS